MRRFSIRTLMAVIVIAATGLAAVRNCSPVWSGAVLSITLFAMTCSPLGIAFGRGQRRVYWTGFATLGWTYLLLWFVPYLWTNVGQYLLAPNLFEHLEQVLHAEAPAPGFQSVPPGMLAATATGGGFSGPAVPTIDPTPCIRIGIALEALLWASLGGYAATYFASGRGEENRDVAGPSS